MILICTSHPLLEISRSSKFNSNTRKFGSFQFTDPAYKFYAKWISKLDYINTTMRSIRKVQSDCNILSYFEDETNLEKTYTGYLFDKVKELILCINTMYIFHNLK